MASSQAKATFEAMPIEIVMPRLSDTMVEGVVLRWIKQVGDPITAGEHIADLETEGESLELRVCDGGVLSGILAKEGVPVAVGQTMAFLEPEDDDTASDAPGMSPLARKMAKSLKLDCSGINGTGPHGRVMACDLEGAPVSDGSPIVKKASGGRKVTSTISCMDGYYVFSFDTDMSQLAAISTPIAVQCEKLIGGRYCLFDYVVRSSVKAFLSNSSWLPGGEPLDLLMVMDRGDKMIPLANAAKKSIYNIACERRDYREEGQEGNAANGGDYAPRLAVCDAKASVKDLKNRLSHRPDAIVALGGTSPKTGIEAGRPVAKLMLPVNLYISEASMDTAATHRIVAEFKTLMENPVLLLF